MGVVSLHLRLMLARAANTATFDLTTIPSAGYAARIVSATFNGPSASCAPLGKAEDRRDAAVLRLDVLLPSGHESPALFQSVAASIGLFSLVAY